MLVCDLMILDHAARHPRPSRASEAERWDALGLSSVGYYARLDWLIDQAEAQRVDPVTCGRLRRLRQARREARTTRPA